MRLVALLAVVAAAFLVEGGGHGRADHIYTDDRGHDRVYGGRGNDVIESAGGSRDVVLCGPGRDTVKADRLDRIVSDCERVTRL